MAFGTSIGGIEGMIVGKAKSKALGEPFARCGLSRFGELRSLADGEAAAAPA